MRTLTLKAPERCVLVVETISESRVFLLTPLVETGSLKIRSLRVSELPLDNEGVPTNELPRKEAR